MVLVLVKYKTSNRLIPDRFSVFYRRMTEISRPVFILSPFFNYSLSPASNVLFGLYNI